MSLRLMLVADDPLSASALRRALRATSAFDVMRRLRRGPRALRRGSSPPTAPTSWSSTTCARARTRSPASARSAAELPEAKIVLLPARMEPAWLAEAAGAGADAAIAKTFRLEGLGALVREVAAGNVFHAFGAPQAPPPAARRLRGCRR